MAASTIDSELIVLACGRWGPAISEPVLLDGLTGVTHHNVAAPAYPVGTVIRVRNDSGVAGQPGFAELVYLQCVANATVAIAARQLLVPDSATLWYRVTNAPDDAAVANTALPTVPAVVAISAMTTLYYGWFWCGGICPQSHVSALGGNYATENNVVAGPISPHDLDADAIGLGPTAAGEVSIGWAIADDA